MVVASPVAIAHHGGMTRDHTAQVQRAVLAAPDLRPPTPAEIAHNRINPDGPRRTIDDLACAPRPGFTGS